MKIDDLKKVLNHRDSKLICDVRTAPFIDGVIQMELSSVEKSKSGEVIFTFRPLSTNQIALKKYKH